MKRILVLGGIREAKVLAEDLCARDWQVIYSVLGITGPPRLRCRVRQGGFGGPTGLLRYVQDQEIDLLVDATHPYAEQISRNAAEAAQRAGVPLWAYRRPPWEPSTADEWACCRGWSDVVDALRPFRRPFFTVGRLPLEHLDAITPHQHWLVRSLVTNPPSHPRLTVISARGPFVAADEIRLMRAQRADVLIAKNSGGTDVAAKIVAARDLGLPVLMWARPASVRVDREFRRIQDLAKAIGQS